MIIYLRRDINQNLDIWHRRWKIAAAALQPRQLVATKFETLKHNKFQVHQWNMSATEIESQSNVTFHFYIISLFLFFTHCQN